MDELSERLIEDVTSKSADMWIRIEQRRGYQKYGKYASWHEAYAVIQEELDEFWDSVKANNPNPGELLQVAATARRAMVELCEHIRLERKLK